MPPKEKIQIPTSEEILEINDRLSKNEQLTEADFNKIINASKGDSDLKRKAAQLIPRISEKFPKQNEKSIATLISLAKVEEAEVRILSLRSLRQIDGASNEKVMTAYIEALSDAEPRVQNIVSPYLESILSNTEDKEKLSFVFSSLKSLNPEAQVKIIDLIKEKVVFNETNVDQLIDLIEVSLKSAVLEGLKLTWKNIKIIPAEKKDAILKGLIDRFEASIDKQFVEICGMILPPILKYTRMLGDDLTKQLFSVIGAKVLPKYEQLEGEVKCKILQSLAGIAHIIDSEEFFVTFYKTIFMTFPVELQKDESFPFSLFEAALFAFFRLSKKHSKIASSLIGTHLIFTGQPGENDDVKEDAKLYQEFINRIQFGEKIAKQFVEFQNSQYDKFKKEISDSEERQEKLRLITIGQRLGNNVLHFCRILQKPNFTTENPPPNVSWKKQKKMIKKQYRSNDRSRKPNHNTRNNRNSRPFRR